MDEEPKIISIESARVKRASEWTHERLEGIMHVTGLYVKALTTLKVFQVSALSIVDGKQFMVSVTEYENEPDEHEPIA